LNSPTTSPINEETQVTLRRIFLLWFPLAVMWIFMAIEQPGVNAVIARLPQAKEHLAAYGVTFSFALIIESPIIQMLAAATALTDGIRNYRRLLRFMHLWAVALTLLHLLLGLSPLYALILRHLLGVPEQIIGISRTAFLIMTPWTATIGYRRLWQGVLIRYGKTRRISYTMFCRLAATLGTLLIGYVIGWKEGSYLAAAALIMGVTAGMGSAYLFARPVIRELPEESGGKVADRRYLFSFYYPLALTSIITFLARPVLNYGIARAGDPLESLAVWPVVLSVMFIFRSVTMAYQEVAVALLKADKDILMLRRFAVLLAGAVGVLFLGVALSPAADFWYREVAGLSPELLPFTTLPSVIVSFVPVLTAFLSWYRGLFIYYGKTGVIARAVGLNTLSLTLMVLLIPQMVRVDGATIAAVSFTLSLLLETAFLFVKAQRSLNGSGR
jgi:hypothetical protein